MPWYPRNKYCWDFWFAWQGQTLHVFYLQASQLACAYNPERRHSLASIGHAVLTNFGWKEIDLDKPVLEKERGISGTISQFGREASFKKIVSTICSTQRDAEKIC